MTERINVLWCDVNSLDPELSVPAGQTDLSGQTSHQVAHVRLDVSYPSLVPFSSNLLLSYL